MGGVHGGWALTLIDSAGGCAGHSLLPVGAGYATVETKANFSRPITKDTGRVRAEARALGRGRQIGGPHPGWGGPHPGPWRVDHHDSYERMSHVRVSSSARGFRQTVRRQMIWEG